MAATENYSVTEHLCDGREVEIRALRSEDKDDMLAAVGRTGTESLRRRFFVGKRGFSEREIAFFMNIDFANHVALVAIAEEDPKGIIGGGYLVTEPGDRLRRDRRLSGLGIGSALSNARTRSYATPHEDWLETMVTYDVTRDGERAPQAKRSDPWVR